MMRILISLALVLTSTSAFAARLCFSTRHLKSVDIVRQGLVVAETKEGRYLVSSRSCGQMFYADHFGFEHWTASHMQQICPGDYLLLLDFVGREEGRCYIDGIKEDRISE